MGQFVPKPKPTYGKAYPLYVFQGTAIRKDSDEAKAQIAAGYGKLLFIDVLEHFDNNIQYQKLNQSRINFISTKINRQTSIVKGYI